MGLNAVQSFLAAQLDGLSSPYYNEANSRVAPPSQDDIAAPKLYVWGSTFEDVQFTMPRAKFDATLERIIGSGGTRKRTYSCKIWVVVACAADDPNIDQGFACLIDAILFKIMSIIPVQVITDPTTNEATGITSIGDRFNVEVAPVRTLADQRFVRLDGLITAHIEEMSGT